MYHIKKTDKDGSITQIELDGAVRFFNTCARCGKELELVDEEFWEVVSEHGLFDSAWFCDERCRVRHDNRKVVQFTRRQ